MHAVVMESFEEYLSGTLEPAAQRAVESHLSTCVACRQEMLMLRDVSQLFGPLRSEEVFEPSPGFFAGVMERVRERSAVPSFASLFSVDMAFGRRLAFASLLTLAILGSY